MNNSGQFLSIIKSFMLDLNEELSKPEIMNPGQIQIIDEANRQLRNNQDNILALQNQNQQITSSRAVMSDYKKQCQHLEKRVSRKDEEIDILKQTVKTLYADNEKIAKEKQTLNQEIIALKEQNSSLKKKNKRQEDELGNNKSDLQKLTALAEERLNEYLKQDQEKQIKIKKLQNQLEKYKNQVSKKEKSLNSLSKKHEELKGIEMQYERTVSMLEAQTHENRMIKSELESIRESIHDEKLKYLNENQNLLKQIEELNEKESSARAEKQEALLKWQTEMEKSQSYEEQIMIRTEKLKEKNKQIKAYNDQIQKLARRVKELSQMADEVMNENRDLTNKCMTLEQKLEELKVVHSHLGKLSGELSYKKGVELGRMVDYINKLQASL